MQSLSESWCIGAAAGVALAVLIILALMDTLSSWMRYKK